jgi:hypothetical protein
MEYSDFLRRVRKLGFTIKEFADFIGVKHTSVYIYSFRSVPVHVQRLIEALEKQKLAEDKLKECEEPLSTS